ncbi:MAG TPA: hypothetical protein VK619_10370 [Pyrinomonadaceae bacterium]|nr:hypothetical protein [Pyrinomonadaceae bacterium]
MNYEPLVEITPGSLVAGLAAVALLALVVAYFWVQFKKGVDDAEKTALNNWKELAASEQAKYAALVAEKAGLQKRYEQLMVANEECEKLRDDFAKHVLRARSREEKYQRCINRLEFELKIEPTDFDDPTMHITSSPNS